MYRSTHDFCEEIINDLLNTQEHYCDVSESVYELISGLRSRLDDEDPKSLLARLRDGLDDIYMALWDDEVIKTSLMDKITAHIESVEDNKSNRNK